MLKSLRLHVILFGVVFLPSSAFVAQGQQQSTSANTPSQSSRSVSSSEAERLTKPCLYKAEHRQFDFWIGEWDVQVSGQPAGTNSIQRILDGCVLFENWTGASGVTGKSFNIYNAATRKWQQTWVDSTGSILELSGEYKDGKLSLSGETAQSNGTRMLQRLTFFNLSPERVRQLWEQSTDGGKTWSIVFDGMYVRKKAQP